MTAEELRERIPLNELVFSASRSGGPGGQNVNKVNTRVELRFDVRNTAYLNDTEKEKIFLRLRKRINSDGVLIITSQSERTQFMNKKKSEEKFFSLIAAALTDKPGRKLTQPTSASKKERLEKKKIRSNVKRLRRDADLMDE